MANEFVISNGFISKNNSIVSGTLTATTITASTITSTTIFSSGNTIVGGQFVSLGGTSTTSPTYRTSLGGSNLSPRGTFGIESVGASNHRYSLDPVNQNGLVFTVANNGSVYIARASITVTASGGIGSEIGTMIFNTLNGSDNSERMRINNLGNVGINNVSPAEKLDVVGKTKTTSIQITSGATNGYVLTSDSSGNGTWQQSPLLSGGTINGNLTITGTTTSGTISATTYQNLPTDIRVTGATYNNNTFTYTNNTGGTFDVSFNTMTGLTINGNLSASTGSSSIDLQPNKLDLTFSSDTKILIDGLNPTSKSITMVGARSIGITASTDTIGYSTLDLIENYISAGTRNDIYFTVYDGSNPIKTFRINSVNYNLSNVPAYADDTDAGGNGLVEGDIYQTTGAGASPLNVPGILMIKQP